MGHHKGQCWRVAGVSSWRVLYDMLRYLDFLFSLKGGARHHHADAAEDKFQGAELLRWGTGGVGNHCINLVPQTQFFIPVLVCDNVFINL